MALTQITTKGIKDGTITGTDLATNIDLVDNQKLRLGTGNDLQIHSDGTNGVIRQNDNSGGLYIQADNFVQIGKVNAASPIYAKFINSGAVELYYDNSVKLATTGAGVDINGNLNFDDNEYALFGNSNDLQIYHDGSNSYIQDAGTGSLYIKSSAQLYLQSYGGETFLKADANGAVELYHNNSKKLETTSAGATVTGTLTATNILFGDSTGTNRIKFGTDEDLQIYHNGNNNKTYIGNKTSTDLLIENAGTNTDIVDDTGHYRARFIKDGAVELYYDNGKKFETVSNGVTVTGRILPTGNNNVGVVHNDNIKSVFGNSDDLQIYHNGTENIITTNNSAILQIRCNGTEKAIEVNPDGNVELYYDNSKKLETTATGVALSGNLELNGAGSNVSTSWDNAAWEKVIFDASYNTNPQGPNKIVLQNDSNWKAGFGISNNEVGMYSGGNINFYSKTTDSTASTKENLAKFISDGGVELYYDNSKKFETVSNGVSVTGSVLIGDSSSGRLEIGASQDLQIYHNASTGHNYINFYNGALIFADGNTNRAYFHATDGHFLPWANNTYDLGSTSNRWRNVYTNDLNLSNEGSSNDVDGTWGSYTIQEGAEDLFLVNKRNGKKYKFNLTEVS